MGLTITSGILADFIKNEPEGYEAYKAEFEQVNKLLELNGYKIHLEPNKLDVEPLNVGGFPYSFLHYLRRFFAYHMNNENWTPTPFDENLDPAADAIVEEETSMFYSHLLVHSDCVGYYIPIDFEDVIFDTDEYPVPGAMIGSSYGLLTDLKSVAKKLGVELNENLEVQSKETLYKTIDNQGDFWIEKIVWLTLFEAANYSIKNKTAIVFN
ncbi:MULTISPECIES: hypothetical protein [unclassified Cellulophaga]|uniref:hypothetical protein n=1 Tax=unclassified Cellulophaga TaxID=2634405 RepID=UPI0026E46667|nr:MULTISPECIES: hypothetical protein [unclassified Cellulophaga]MDO6490860.1 hypothetical protein [Cellulophaga sp. 2_MG-2023]MDO6493946.1 hypothetical protein [Cellulophaga sp. 3_MG-2023]